MSAPFGNLIPLVYLNLVCIGQKSDPFYMGGFVDPYPKVTWSLVDCCAQTGSRPRQTCFDSFMNSDLTQDDTGSRGIASGKGGIRLVTERPTF